MLLQVDRDVSCRRIPKGSRSEARLGQRRAPLQQEMPELPCYLPDEGLRCDQADVLDACSVCCLLCLDGRRDDSSADRKRARKADATLRVASAVDTSLEKLLVPCFHAGGDDADVVHAGRRGHRR